jgi:hypothetical protein
MTRRPLRKQYDELHDVVLRAFNESDPMELLSAGAPADQYESEVGAILPRLRTASSRVDVLRILDEEFAEWFANGSSESAVFERPAAQIWEYLERRRRPTRR